MGTRTQSHGTCIGSVGPGDRPRWSNTGVGQLGQNYQNMASDYRGVARDDRRTTKHSRVNACAPIFESEQVWYPRDEHFAHEVIEECAAFPHGEHDDYVDSTTQAMLRYRQGSFITTYSDEDEIQSYKQRKYVYY